MRRSISLQIKVSLAAVASMVWSQQLLDSKTKNLKSVHSCISVRYSPFVKRSLYVCHFYFGLCAVFTKILNEMITEGSDNSTFPINAVLIIPN